MKLKKFDATNTVAKNSTGRTGKNAITLYRYGLVILSSQFIEKSGFKAGDKVAIHQDEESKEDWYISKDDKGFPLESAGKGQPSTSLKMNCAGVTEILWKQFQLPDTDKSVSMLMAGTPEVFQRVSYWGVLTTSANWNGKI